MEFSVRGRGNPIHRNAVIHDGIVCHGVIVHDGSLFENRSNLVVRQSVMSKVTISEVVHRDKSEVLWTQAEIKIRADAYAVKAQTRVNVETGVRRQRSPTTTVP